MPIHETRLIEHAIAVLRAMKDGPPVPPPAERLACRFLAGYVGTEAMMLFYTEVKAKRTPWGATHLSMRIEAIETVARARAAKVPPPLDSAE